MSRPAIYVLSTGRAGTHFIQQLVNRLVGNERVTHQSSWSRLANVVGNLSTLQGVTPKLIGPVARFLEPSRPPTSTADPLRSLLITHLLGNDSTSDFRIIHLVRDPRDFVTSFMNWKGRGWSGLIAHHLVPMWQPSPLWTGEASLANRMQMTKFEHFSWIWNYKNQLFIDRFAGKSNYWLVRLEDFSSAAAHQSIIDLCDFLPAERPGESELDTTKDVLRSKPNASRDSEFPKWPTWSADQVRTLQHHCGSLMKRFGYGLEDAWLAKSV